MDKRSSPLNFSNKKLVGATLISFALQMLVVYVPFLQTIFKTEALGLFDWVMVLVISLFFWPWSW
jgi:Ca2+-transporting ATPase